jgi:hypothetical protein
MSKVKGIVEEKRHWSGSFPFWFGFEKEQSETWGRFGFDSDDMMERQICCLSGAIKRQIHIQGWATFCKKFPKDGEPYQFVTFDTIESSRHVVIKAWTHTCVVVIHPMGKIVIEGDRSQFLREIVEVMQLIKHVLIAEYPVIDIKATLLPEAAPVTFESSDYEYDSESIDYNDIRSITSEELNVWLDTPLGCC